MRSGAGSCQAQEDVSVEDQVRGLGQGAEGRRRGRPVAVLNRDTRASQACTGAGGPGAPDEMLRKAVGKGQQSAEDAEAGRGPAAGVSRSGVHCYRNWMAEMKCRYRSSTAEATDSVRAPVLPGGSGWRRHSGRGQDMPRQGGKGVPGGWPVAMVKMGCLRHRWPCIGSEDRVRYARQNVHQAVNEVQWPIKDAETVWRSTAGVSRHGV